jgi:uncharacterized membrane protein YciS (DUF1049 family)
VANIFFIIAHICAVLFGFVFLIITVPFHLFYLNGKRTKKTLQKQTDIMEKEAKAKKKEEKASKECPFCAELIKKEAKVCKHCGKDIEES